MRRQVSGLVVWDDARAFYEGEDVDFSRRCQREGFQISHCHEMVVFHDDASYTNVGRRVLRRADGRTPHWAQSAIRQLSASAVLSQIRILRREGRGAEAADLLRLAMARHFWNVSIRRKWWNMVKDSGGRLPGAAWYPDGDPMYVDAVRESSRT
jgi:GT2 family glycosyltransferase